VGNRVGVGVGVVVCVLAWSGRGGDVCVGVGVELLIKGVFIGGCGWVRMRGCERRVSVCVPFS